MRHKYTYNVTVTCETCGEEDTWPTKWQAQEWAKAHTAEHRKYPGDLWLGEDTE